MTADLIAQVMLRDGLRIKEHNQKRTPKIGSTRILKFKPTEKGGTLTWERPIAQKSVKPKMMPLACISEAELDVRMLFSTMIFLHVSKCHRAVHTERCARVRKLPVRRKINRRGGES